ncbi:hypothetical protein B0J13DRAFT_533302 [Dactylonectria estremocensis]|uniref:Uncharacterized protein n=1 Tax=Dactylonectria estremocensis TaxID=1079267 RepID=A0A9P9DAV8_9HYPO|nr:hypothetical protein B0J13DRAFT_533302 [Dactylonectria estremocensis]
MASMCEAPLDYDCICIFLLLTGHENAYSQGVFSLSNNILQRSLPNPVGEIQSQATEIAGGTGDIVGKVTTAVAQATRVAADVTNKASSAVAAAETLVSGAIPKACNIGIKSGCIEYGDGHSDCVELPMEGNGSFGQLAATYAPAQSLVEALKQASLLTFVRAGLVLVVIFSAFYIISLFCHLWLRSLVCILLSISSLAMFTCFGAFVWTIYSGGRALGELADGSFHSGYAFYASICLFSLSFCHFGLVVLQAALPAV